LANPKEVMINEDDEDEEMMRIFVEAKHFKGRES
jgi:hypothetical protein